MADAVPGDGPAARTAIEVVGGDDETPFCSECRSLGQDPSRLGRVALVWVAFLVVEAIVALLVGDRALAAGFVALTIGVPVTLVAGGVGVLAFVDFLANRSKTPKPKSFGCEWLRSPAGEEALALPVQHRTWLNTRTRRRAYFAVVLIAWVALAALDERTHSVQGLFGAVATPATILLYGWTLNQLPRRGWPMSVTLTRSGIHFGKKIGGLEVRNMSRTLRQSLVTWIE